MIKIIEYNGEKEIIVKFMENLQDYLIGIDSLKRTIRLEGYGESYTNNLLEKVKNNNGIIYVAKEEGIPIGMIAGIILEQEKEDKLECVESKSGAIIELIVDEKYRGKNIGKLLMDKIEGYFKDKKCNTLLVEVFEPNKNAHEFYKKFGYQDRMISMIKVLT